MEINTSTSDKLTGSNSPPLSPAVRSQLESGQEFNTFNDPLKLNEDYQKSLMKNQRGRIELILGPMFAGKSTELLRRVRRLEFSGKKCLNVKYAADQRYSTDCISTHDKQMRTAISVQKLSQTEDYWRQFDVIGIDEGQFYEDTCEFADIAANSGKIVIISALNGSFARVGWNPILELIPLAEKIIKLTAICKICGNNANFTFRTCNSQQTECIGGSESYMPLCRECYNEKSKQQKISAQILDSENKSVETLNESGNGDKEVLLDMDKMNNSSAEQKTIYLSKNFSAGDTIKQTPNKNQAVSTPELLDKKSEEEFSDKQMKNEHGLVVNFDEDIGRVQDDLRKAVKQ